MVPIRLSHSVTVVKEPSSLLRKYLQSGKLNKVNKLLDRKWSIDGKVQKGRQLGKKIGFPTANIDIKDYVLAKFAKQGHLFWDRV